MLEGQFYDIQSFTDTLVENSICKIDAEISLIGSHPVFNGHFPGNPIVPGVCELQIIRELCSKVLKESLTLVRSDNIKFLQTINPVVNPILKVSISIKSTAENLHDVTASIHAGAVVFLKFRGIFKQSCE